MHPVYFFSKKTTKEEEKYHSYELKVLAIMKALKRFRVYLVGINFKIVTNWKAFTQTVNKKEPCPRVARPWSCRSTISRSSRVRGFAAKVAKGTEDPAVQKLIQEVDKGKGTGFCLQGGLVFKEDIEDIKLVVPKAM